MLALVSRRRRGEIRPGHMSPRGAPEVGRKSRSLAARRRRRRARPDTGANRGRANARLGRRPPSPLFCFRLGLHRELHRAASRQLASITLFQNHHLALANLFITTES